MARPMLKKTEDRKRKKRKMKKGSVQWCLEADG
jgi:hypothetical protein